jgi:hypothetical protein
MYKVASKDMYYLPQGLSNQLFELSNGIIEAYVDNKRVLIINDFSQDYNNKSFIGAENVIDIDQLNKYLVQYGISVVSRQQCEIKILSVNFGIHYRMIDITEEIMRKCVENGKFKISKNLELNSLKLDPACWTVKKLYIKYSINNIIIDEVYEEKRTSDIEFSIEKIFKYLNHGTYINLHNTKMFNDILKNIKFAQKYIDISRLISEKQCTPNLNVIHLRNEDDAIAHWSKLNSMDAVTYKNKLNAKYTELILKYFDKNTKILVLTYNTNNDVIKFLKDHNYNYFVNDKLLQGRENNAIIDLLLGEHCTQNFIGNYRPLGELKGSTFSYLLYHRLPPTVSKIMIAIESINQEEYLC